jgi:hypothetical protein
MHRWRTTGHENGVSAGPVAQVFVRGDFLKIVFLLVTAIPLFHSSQKASRALANHNRVFGHYGSFS